MSENFPRPILEVGEVLIRAVLPEWLGGFFESGGTLCFAFGHGYVYPRLSVGDNNMEKLIALTRILGGGVSRVKDHKRDEEHNVWTLSKSELAVCLAEHMQQYAPSCQEIILAFLNWENVESAEERLEIAHMAKGIEKPVLSVGDYLPLVRIPGFLAGVLDNRGCIVDNGRVSGDHDWITPGLQVKSTNGGLLEALQVVHGGHFGITIKQGTVMTKSRGDVYVATRDSYEWCVGVDMYRQMAKQLNGHLKLLQL